MKLAIKNYLLNKATGKSGKEYFKLSAITTDDREIVISFDTRVIADLLNITPTDLNKTCKDCGTYPVEK